VELIPEQSSGKGEKRMHKHIIPVATAIAIISVCIGTAAAAGWMGTGMQNGRFVDKGWPGTLPDLESSLPKDAAFANSETIWTSAGNAYIMDDFVKEVGFRTHQPGFFVFVIKNETATALTIPFTSPSVKNRIKPQVRYLWFQLRMPVGVNVTRVGVYSGPAQIFDAEVVWNGTGKIKDYPLDLGSHYSMNRGIDTALLIENSGSTRSAAFFYSAGAKLQW
jgi:hypothetical protein